MRKVTGSLILSLFLSGCASVEKPEQEVEVVSDETKTEQFYQQLISGSTPNIAQLNLFLTAMPKGGDLHHHYSGSLYVETYLDWVEDKQYCVDVASLKIKAKMADNETCLTATGIRNNSVAYRKLLTLWSDKDYSNHYHDQPAPDQNFFNTFGYFGPVSKAAYDKGLNILKDRAKKENVLYIETMLGSVPYSYQDELFDRNVRNSSDQEELFIYFDQLGAKIEQDQGFNRRVNYFVEKLNQYHQGIDDADFTMRYQSYASRNSDPSKVFSRLYAAFKASNNSDLIVGVNIVGPENGVVAIQDYRLHMQMFNYLRGKYPSVNRALHAGELTLGMVRPKNLTFHITDAVNIAGAQRIGHGIDLPYEDNATELLQIIKEKSVIEINLTSNEFILGVKGQEHPYLIYSAYDVPMVISTDDSGVSRNNLTHEYVLLSSRYKPDYLQVKEYVYNSIRYSFADDEIKQQMTETLNMRFDEFERKMSEFSQRLK